MTASYAEETLAPAGDDVRALLEQLRDSQRSPVDGHAASLVDRTWDALAAVINDSSDATRAPLLAALRQLQQVDTALVQVSERRSDDPLARLRSALGRLEEAECTVDELVGLAPGLICELGFERAIISHIEDGLWIPRTVFVTNDPLWAQEIARSGQERPQPLVQGLRETEMVRRRQAVLVTGVQDDPRVHRAIADASMSRSYVATPLVSAGRVVGFLHADRYGQQREVDAADRELLAAFTEGLRLALSRATLVQRLAQTNQGLQALTQSLGSVDARDVTLVTHGNGLLGAVRLGPSSPTGERPQADPLAAALTRRELEVLRLMAEGRTNAAIARVLVVAESTVKQHVKHILRKLSAGNRAEAISLWFHSNERG